MTNTEWLNELIPDISQEAKFAILEARGADPAASYTGGKELELATADLYMMLVAKPDFSEGSLSIKYDKSSLKLAANQIYKKYDDPRYEGGPYIKSVSL